MKVQEHPGVYQAAGEYGTMHMLDA